MNTDQMKGNWKQLVGKAKEKWGKLTDNDWQIVEGKRDQLVGRIQERYGIARQEAERLFPLTRDGDYDRGPFDFVRLPAEPVGIEHNVQVRPGIHAMPSAVLLGHRLLHPLWLWLFRHFQGSSTSSALRARDRA